MKNFFLLVLTSLTLYSCISIKFPDSIKADIKLEDENDNIKHNHKVGMQFLLDVKYPDIYEKAYQDYRDNLSSILNDATMSIAKIDGKILGNANYINVVTAKNKEHLDTLLDRVSKSEYHKKYHLDIGLDKGDVKVISVAKFEFK